jgi:hypothetical protein
MVVSSDSHSLGGMRAGSLENGRLGVHEGMRAPIVANFSHLQPCQNSQYINIDRVLSTFHDFLIIP